jgi:hypothetical protein
VKLLSVVVDPNPVPLNTAVDVAVIVEDFDEAQPVEICLALRAPAAFGRYSMLCQAARGSAPLVVTFRSTISAKLGLSKIALTVICGDGVRSNEWNVEYDVFDAANDS